MLFLHGIKVTFKFFENWIYVLSDQFSSWKRLHKNLTNICPAHPTHPTHPTKKRPITSFLQALLADNLLMPTRRVSVDYFLEHGLECIGKQAVPFRRGVPIQFKIQLGVVLVFAKDRRD